MTIVVKKVPKCLRGIVKFLFKIKDWYIIATNQGKKHLNIYFRCFSISFG